MVKEKQVLTKKNILLTFDYELFQGKRSGTVSNCIIAPTGRLLNTLDQYSAKAVFFVDMLYVHRLSEAAEKYAAAKEDYLAVTNQIVDIANRGHYVFNHLHPHWLDAVYHADENQWDLTNTSRYSFLALSEEQRNFVFQITMNLLRTLLSCSRNKTEPYGFRAGGLYIQPFSIFKPYFQKFGIKYDFSVLIGVKGQLEDNSNEFDFSVVKDKSYEFANNVETKTDNGAYQEFALRPFEIPFSKRLGNSVLHRLYKFTRNDYNRYGDGIASINRIYRNGRKLGTAFETFSVELLNEVKLPLYLNEVEKQRYVHFLSHPKLISEYNLRIFNEFLFKVTETGDVEFDFEEFKLN